MQGFVHMISRQKYNAAFLYHTYTMPDNARDCQSYSNFFKLKTHYFNNASYNHIIC